MRLLVSGSVALVAEHARHYRELLGHILTPRNNNTPVSVAATELPWAADNGCYQRWEPGRFRSFLARLAGLPRCLFVVAPDVVGSGAATLSLWHEWHSLIRATGQPVAFVAQDGAPHAGVPWAELNALFLGGSDGWRRSQAARELLAEARARGKHVHIGRVNTQRRLQWALDLGADTVDGSIFSRMSDKFLLWGLRYLARIHAQPALFGENCAPRATNRLLDVH